MNDDLKISEPELLARLDALPGERAPAADLWPAIQARLRKPGSVSSWWSQAAAAMLVAALGLAVVRIGGDRQPLSVVGGTPVVWQDTLGADLEYSGALRDLRGLGLLDASSIPAATRDEFVFNLRLVEEASRQVRAAIEKNPDASYLTVMLASLQRKRLDVLRDMALSSSAGESTADDQRRAS